MHSNTLKKGSIVSTHIYYGTCKCSIVTYISSEWVTKEHTVSELIDAGFGNTKEILLKLKERDDFKSSVETLYDTEDPGDGEYFDARELLLSE